MSRKYDAALLAFADRGPKISFFAIERPKNVASDTVPGEIALHIQQQVAISVA